MNKLLLTALGAGAIAVVYKLITGRDGGLELREVIRKKGDWRNRIGEIDPKSGLVISDKYGVTEQECFDEGLDLSKGEFYECMAKGYVISRKGDKAHTDLSELKKKGVKL